MRSPAVGWLSYETGYRGHQVYAGKGDPQQDLIAIYQRQTRRRDELTENAEEAMRQLASEIQTGTRDNQRIKQLMANLAQRLHGRSGKKQYGYLLRH